MIMKVQSPKSKVQGQNTFGGARLRRALIPFLFALLIFKGSAQIPIYSTNSLMIGTTNDTTINVKAVNNPTIWNGQFYRLPVNGTNFTTTNGIGLFNLVPGKYIAAYAGIPQSFQFSVTNSDTALNLADLIETGHGVVFYSGVESITGLGGLIVTPPTGSGGKWTIDASGVSGGGGGGGGQPPSLTLTNWGKWDTNSYAVAVINRALALLGSAAFTLSSAYDGAGTGLATAMAATNSMGLTNSQIMAFQNTNSFLPTNAPMAGGTLIMTNSVGQTGVAISDAGNVKASGDVFAGTMHVTGALSGGTLQMDGNTIHSDGSGNLQLQTLQLNGSTDQGAAVSVLGVNSSGKLTTSSIPGGGNVTGSGSSTTGNFAQLSDSTTTHIIDSGKKATDFDQAGAALAAATAATNGLIAVSPNIYFVETNGNDVTAVVGMRNKPFRTFTNALASAVAPAKIILGVGTFYTDASTNGSALLSNISIQGQGVAQTVLMPGNLSLALTTGSWPCELVIAGDNITLSDFTCGTNANNGTYYMPIALSRGTNTLITRMKIVGDSDAIWGNSTSDSRFFSTNCSGIVENSTLVAGYDTVMLSAATGATNSTWVFQNVNVRITGDTNFGTGVQNRAFNFAQFTNVIQNCNISILSSNCSKVIGVNQIGGNTNWLTLANNVFNLAGPSPTWLNFISARGDTTVRGMLDPSMVNQNGSVIHWDAADGSNITNINASALASGTVAPARLGSGTANSTTFLRGDQTYATPGGSGDVVAANVNTFTGASNVFSGKIYAGGINSTGALAAASATVGGFGVATTNQLISYAGVTQTNQYLMTDANTNPITTLNGNLWTNLVSWTHKGTTTNITASFNGTMQTFTVTNGPSIGTNLFFHFAGANGSVSYRIVGAAAYNTLAFDYQPKWISGSNNVITNGVLSLTSYGGTNAAQIEAAMRENQ